MGKQTKQMENFEKLSKQRKTNRKTRKINRNKKNLRNQGKGQTHLSEMILLSLEELGGSRHVGMVRRGMIFYGMVRRGILYGMLYGILCVVYCVLCIVYCICALYMIYGDKHTQLQIQASAEAAFLFAQPPENIERCQLVSASCRHRAAPLSPLSSELAPKQQLVSWNPATPKQKEPQGGQAQGCQKLQPCEVNMRVMLTNTRSCKSKLALKQPSFLLSLLKISSGVSS